MGYNVNAYDPMINSSMIFHHATMGIWSQSVV